MIKYCDKYNEKTLLWDNFLRFSNKNLRLNISHHIYGFVNLSVKMTYPAFPLLYECKLYRYIRYIRPQVCRLSRGAATPYSCYGIKKGGRKGGKRGWSAQRSCARDDEAASMERQNGQNRTWHFFIFFTYFPSPASFFRFSHTRRLFLVFHIFLCDLLVNNDETSSQYFSILASDLSPA